MPIVCQRCAAPFMQDTMYIVYAVCERLCTADKNDVYVYIQNRIKKRCEDTFDGGPVLKVHSKS